MRIFVEGLLWKIDRFVHVDYTSAINPMHSPLGLALLMLTFLAWMGLFFYLGFEAVKRIKKSRRAKLIMQGKDPMTHKKLRQKRLRKEGRT